MPVHPLLRGGMTTLICLNHGTQIREECRQAGVPLKSPAELGTAQLEVASDEQRLKREEVHLKNRGLKVGDKNVVRTQVECVAQALALHEPNLGLSKHRLPVGHQPGIFVKQGRKSRSRILHRVDETLWPPMVDGMKLHQVLPQHVPQRRPPKRVDGGTERVLDDPGWGWGWGWGSGFRG